MKMVSHCGLICSECPAYIAKRTGDNELKIKTAEIWSEMYGAEIKPEAVNCDGCTVDEGAHFSHCSVCAIRKCASSREVQNCAYCGEYPCATVSELHDMVPEAKELLDEIRSKINN